MMDKRKWNQEQLVVWKFDIRPIEEALKQIKYLSTLIRL